MEIIRDLLIFIAAMFAMCIVLIIVVSNLPDQNPFNALARFILGRRSITLTRGDR